MKSEAVISHKHRRERYGDRNEQQCARAETWKKNYKAFNDEQMWNSAPDQAQATAVKESLRLKI